MEAITREEKIMSGENLTPITRREKFLAKLVGKEIETPQPITRAEKIMSGEQLSPITREEMFLAKAAGQGIEVPTPITRKEMFLNDVFFEEPTYHTIRFISEGVVLQESILAYGEIPVYVGEEPTKTDYKFVGWTPEIVPVTGDADYVAKFVFSASATRALLKRIITEISNDSLTVVGIYSFAHCIALTSVDLPNVTSIDKSAFEKCFTLASVNIPSVTSIGASAFSGCPALTSVRLPATPPTLSSTNAFFSINGTCVFYIPTGSLSAYQNATNWSSLTSQYSFVEEDR